MDTNILTITVARPDDAKLLTNLGIITFSETFMADNKKEDMDKYIAEEMNQERITAELNDSNNLFLLGIIDAVVAGYAKIRATKRPAGLDSERPLELERLYVLKEYHGKKVGARLMDYCISYATNNKYDALWLGVWEHNHRAVNFYKKWGFEQFGSHIFRLGDDDQTDILMKKTL